jgi:NAD(P)-dependent dehydrogenase (short-subunit alcohol dehydrogenase family)
MRGKTVVTTGGTSRIGEVAAVILARLALLTPYILVISYAWLKMKRVAAQIAASEPRIDVLISNAGALFAKRRTTEDGLERTFALNHMAYFVVTEGLRERLLASSPARIVNTASSADQGSRLDFDDLQSAKSFGAMNAYGRSKLCNILFTLNSLAA